MLIFEVIKLNKYKVILLALFISLFFIASVSAADNENMNENQTIVDDCLEDIDLNQNQDVLKQVNSEEVMGESEEITVNDWNDLQYYCSLKDKDYTLKLKENTNYYPTDPTDSVYQITINNNVRIIGSEGAYFGDDSVDFRDITYTAIKVNDNNGIGITLQNVTFKWIGTRYQSDGVFLIMGGNANNVFENCQFTQISTNIGHSSILQIKSGFALIKNCTFINCTTDFGCLSVYNPNDDPTGLCTRASMEVTDSYFEGNYARTEPGCINNCGILVVNNSTFYRNSAFWWAGAIHTHGGANTTIYDSDFIDNVAGWNGGALYTYSYLQIYRSNFIGNNCTTNNGGGAIGACRYLHSPYIHIEDSLFMDNENLCWGLDNLSTTGTGRGGAISLMDSGSLEVYNNIFISNSASIGTAICAINGGANGSPDVRIVGNQFINHTRVGDVLNIRLAVGSISEIRDNYFANNSIEFSKLKLIAEDPTPSGNVTFNLDIALKNPGYYDSDILDDAYYDVYVNGAYSTTVSSRNFTLNLGKGNTAHVYVVPSISNSKSNEVLAGIAKTFIYVSQNSGTDENDGSTRQNPVKTLARAIELANVTENIVIMDGTFGETGLTINYNLTVVAENHATITVTGNAFKITDGDVKFVNLTFKNSKYGSSSKNRLILQENNGFLIFEGCTFEGNEYNTHIEASGIFEGQNLIFTNNKNGALVRCNSISIKSSTFTSNVGTYTMYKSLLMYNTVTSKFEAENLTFIGNTVNSGVINTKTGTGTIIGCAFIGNTAVSGGSSSAIFIEDTSSLIIQSSKFMDNDDNGKSAVIYLQGSVLISDSIFLNNHYTNDKGVVNAVNDAALKRVIANNNWWGATSDNAVQPELKFLPQYWLVLNATAINNELELNKVLPVQFSFNQIDNNGNVTFYDGFNLPSFDLTLTAVNGTCSDDKITVENGIATTYFTLTQKSSASLTGTFNGVSETINFKFIKSVPEMTIDADEITVGENATIVVHLPDGATGEVILNIPGITLIETISNSKASFSVPNLPAGDNDFSVNYTGNSKFDSIVMYATVHVNKHESDINISAGTIELDEDVIFTFTLSNGATGTVDVYVNNVKHTVNVGETFTIEKITRGDYIIRAVYSGDNYYLTSEEEYTFDVGKLIPAADISVLDIVYGNDAVVNVTLQNAATGTVTVTVDGKSKSTDLIAGKASITISNLDAGSNKLINVFYSGDSNYKNGSFNKTFNIAKADVDFTINSNDIKLGRDAIVEIEFTKDRVGGSISLSGIKDEVKVVPITGKLTLTYSDLNVGTYTVSAIYNSNNYNTISKSTTFTVSDWGVPQWANEGGNPEHTGKSTYDSDANGEIKWIGSVDEITGNLAVDSEGNIYVTTINGVYSFDSDGNLRWSYTSTAAGTSFSGISISREVIISPKADDRLFLINQSTGETYGHANLYQGSSFFAPVVDSNGNVYISGQGGSGGNPNLIIIPYRLWENGGNPTVISLGSTPVASPTIVSEDVVCVPCSDCLKIVNISSKTFISSQSGIIVKGDAIVGDGNIIYSFLGDSIVSLSAEGDRIWTKKVTGGVGDKLFLDPEQCLYSVNANGELYKYDLIDGDESKFTNLTVTSGILIGNDGNIYFASSNVFYAFDYGGNLLWKSNIKNEIIGTPIMDENGIIYVNSLNKVYALQQAPLKDVNLSINTQTITISDSEVIIITLNENATGMISIDVAGNVSQEPVINGMIVKTIPGLAAGNYTVTVNYMGDLRYAQSEKSEIFRVLKINPAFSVTVNNIRYGQNAIFNIALPADATGTVTVNVNDKTNSSAVKNGRATISISGLIKGDFKYTVAYSGDSIYSSSAKSGVVSVEKVEFEFAVQPVETGYVGNSVEFIITNLPSQASGKVLVEVAGLSNYSNVGNGQSKVIINGLKEGSYTATVSYYDDNYYMANPKTVSFDVIKQDILFDVTVNDVYVGENATFLISALPEDAMGSIQVTVGDISHSGLLAHGETIINVEGLSSGLKQVTITFSGDDRYNPISISGELNVYKIDPFFAVDNILNVFVSQKVEFKAYLDSDAYGNITVFENGNVLNEIEFVDGEANIALNGFGYGSKTLIIKYSGNYKYNAKEITKTFFVDKIKTDLIVNAPSRVEHGKEIEFEIILPADATGKVNVSVDNVFKIEDAKSKVTISIPDLTEGPKTAYITYSGDSKYHNASVTKQFNVVNQLIVRTIPTVDVTVENISVGDVARFIINIDSDASGSIEVNVDGVRNSTEIISGQAIVELQGLRFGSKNARITYSGDDKYNDTVVFKEFNVNKVSPTFDVSCSNASVGDSLVFDIALNSDATGNVIVRIGNKSNSSILIEGKTKIIINGLTGGINTASINYVGDDKYLPGNVSYNVSVNKLKSPIDVVCDDIDYNSVAVVKVILPKGAGGTVKLIIGNDTYERTVVVSNITFNIHDLDAGEHKLQINYSGDSRYDENSIVCTIKVNKVKPGIDLLVNQDIGYGDDVNLTVSISKATGQILVYVDSNKIYDDKINEKVIIPLTGLDAGNHLIKIVYQGDKNYLSDSKNVTVSVKKDISEDERKVSENILEGTTSLEFTVNLPADATGNFTVYVDGTPYVKELVDGAASIKVENLNVGNHIISTSYSGDNDYKGFESEAYSLNVPKASIVGGDNVFSTNSPQGSDSPSYSIKLPDDATGELTVVVDGKYTYSGSISNGVASVNVAKLSPGKHSIQLTYSGDAKYKGITKNMEITVPGTSVVKVKTKFVAKKKTFKAKVKVKKYSVTLKAGNKPVKNVQVTLKINGKTYNVKTNAKGKATFKIKKLTKKGKYKAVVKFNGNNNYYSVTKTVKITIK